MRDNFFCAFKIHTMSSYYFYKETKKKSFTIKIPTFYSNKKEDRPHIRDNKWK